jgi:hypothetical protein
VRADAGHPGGDQPLAQVLVGAELGQPRGGSVRIEDGADLWLVFDDRDRGAFAFWIFWHTTLVLPAPSGILSLPAGVGSLEDSVTSPEHRSQGIAPGRGSASPTPALSATSQRW